MNLLSFDNFTAEQTIIIEKQLDSLVPETQEAHKSLLTAARYSLLGGGKRLRPILLLATVETLGGNSQQALKTACALEMIHTYSLIHDDLPCMDNDDLRRGKATLHKVYSDAHAVLAGDFLLTHAFHVLATDTTIPEPMRVELITLFSDLAGGKGMIGGQMIDLESEDSTPHIQSLMQMYTMKTGALITAAVLAGAHIAHADSETIAALRTYGNHLGLAFQIVDDLIDVTSTTEEMGKPAHSDEQNGKATYVKLLGIEETKRAATININAALKALESVNTQSSYLQEIAERALERSR